MSLAGDTLPIPSQNTQEIASAILFSVLVIWRNVSFRLRTGGRSDFPPLPLGLSFFNGAFFVSGFVVKNYEDKWGGKA
jgi:hypothetical protein